MFYALATNLNNATTRYNKDPQKLLQAASESLLQNVPLTFQSLDSSMISHSAKKSAQLFFFHGFPGMFQATNGRIGRVPSNKQQQNPTNCCPAASWHKPSRSPTARPPCRMSWKVWVKGGIHFKKNGRNLPRKFGQS